MATFEEFGRTGRMPPEVGAWLHDPSAQYIAPWKAFDNVTYVGVCWVSAWAIRTSDGVVLIDTLHEPHVDQLVANLRKAGIDPADIKYVLMTHGHFDHAGGAARLRPLLPNAKFAMTQIGWDEAIKSAKRSEGTPGRWTMMPQDLVVKDGDVIRLGDNSFGVLETPGHTLGTASYTYDVKDGTHTYRAITVGGLGLNAIRDFKTGGSLYRQRRQDHRTGQAARPAGHGSSHDAPVLERIDRSRRAAGGAQARRTQSAGRSRRLAETARRTSPWRGRAP